MRIVVFGVGAIGGVIAGALADAGHEVAGIARGSQLSAVRDHGLKLYSHNRHITAHIDCVVHPSALKPRPDDILFLCTKSQDTAAALIALREAGYRNQPVFCAQNGVANERMALRAFPHVHGVTVMMPASCLTPGEVTIYSQPRFGIFELGRFPHGIDSDDERMAAILDSANIAGFALEHVMDSKYGKLRMNLSNILEALLGVGANFGNFPKLLREEADDALAAARIRWVDVGRNDPRRAAMLNMTEVAGRPRVGCSTTQSLRKSSGSVETDYLNGEISQIGRMHGVPTPLNNFVVSVAQKVARDREQAGSWTLEQLATAYDAFVNG